MTLALMTGNPPVDANDWAKKALDGTYTADMSETVKKALRDALTRELQVHKSRLKRTTTKELTGEAFPEDIARFAEVYTKQRGDLSKLAAIFGCSIGLMQKNLPRDANDFAKKLLEGFYTGETTPRAKEQMRMRMQDDLARAGSVLKRTTTKEYQGLAHEDVAAIVKVYNDNGGDLEKLAKLCQIPLDVLRRQPPSSAESFAKNLLSCAYQQDQSEAAKASMRGRLKTDLLRKQSTLKRVSTKESQGPTTEELEFMANIYNNNAGNIETLSRILGISLKILKKYPCQNAMDFAKKVFDGTYTEDMSETAKSDLRKKLAWELKVKSQKLKRTTTKEYTGEALPEDIAMFAKVYNDSRGNIDKLVKTFGISHDLIMSNRPKNGEDFAKKLLNGYYIGDLATAPLAEKKQMRTRLKDDLSRQASSLKRTTTKEYTGLAEEDIAAIAQIYDQYGGDPAKLAKICDVPIEILKMRPVHTSREFAQNLLNGVYNQDLAEAAKANMRNDLKKQITRTTSQLKRTVTKEYTGATPQEMQFMANMYTNNGGDLEKLARITGCTLKLMQRDPPRDAMSWARKILDGTYQADQSEVAKSELRSKLGWELKVSGQKALKRTTTKESTGEALSEDIQVIAKIYTQERGNIDKLCSLFYINKTVMANNMPRDAEDFAKKLLGGHYAGEAPEVAKLDLQTEIKSDLKKTITGLKKSHTKEYSGLTADDLTAASRIYDAHKGDLLKISKHCKIDYETLVANAPSNSIEFAKALLAGKYTIDETEQSKAQLRQNLRSDLHRSASQLRRVATKEYGGPSPEEIAHLSKLYNLNNGDLDKLAKLTNCNYKLFEKYPPTSAKDWAIKLLNGTYTQDKTETSKKMMRDRLKWEVKAGQANLKRTVTRVGTGLAMKEDIDKVVELYNKHKGNLDKLATVTGAKLELLAKSRPKDAEDFAKKLLEGVYTGDVGDMARKGMREKLREDLQEQAANLRKAETNENKEAQTPLTQKEIDKVAKIWNEGDGDTRSITKIEAIAKKVGCNPELVLRSFPVNGEDFARKLFEGMYTGDTSQTEKAALRTGLRENLLRSVSTLRRVQTKTYQGLDEEEIELVAQIYIANGGDLAKIAKVCGFPQEVLLKKVPSDGKDFARKLLNGDYNFDNFEVAKSNLRQKLSETIAKQKKGLKRTKTNEFAGISKEELEFVGQLYTSNNGDIIAICKQTGLTEKLIRSNPPTDAVDFAKKLLTGMYTSDQSETAKQQLRDRLKGQLVKQASTLRRTTTKEWNGAASEEDVAVFAKLYDDYKGDLTQISKAFGLNLDLLKERKPVDSKDFARKLLLGRYTEDVHARAASNLRRNLTQTLTSGNTPNLKRTQTKTYSGEPDVAEIMLVAKKYEELNGDVMKLAQFFNANFELIFRNAPRDANDFAKKLLMGTYNDQTTTSVRETLKSLLADDLKMSRHKLKRTETKIGDQEPEADSIAACAMIWEEYDGDLDKIASMTGCSAFLLKKNAPSNSRMFGRNYLLGYYTE